MTVRFNKVPITLVKLFSVDTVSSFCLTYKVLALKQKAASLI